jgi:hypothetical protein
MISHTDHNNKASLLYAPSNGAQGQWIERMTSYNEDNYAVSHQYEFSCEYAEQMKIMPGTKYFVSSPSSFINTLHTSLVCNKNVKWQNWQQSAQKKN